jgi:Tfp pilus assembly protein FimT
MVILIIFVVVASLIPRVSTTLAHSKVNRAAYVIAADFLLAQSLAARQRTPVTVQVRPDSTLFRITDVANGNVLRTDRFDAASEFQLDTLYATPAAAQIMPTGTATASMVVTVGKTTTYYHEVRITQAGQVRITK